MPLPHLPYCPQGQWPYVPCDDARLVLRRPRDARARDALRAAEIDPYRTELRSARMAGALVIVTAVTVALVLGLVLQGGPETGAASWPLMAAIVLALLIVLIVAASMSAPARRR
jgi:hypothetical protein